MPMNADDRLEAAKAADPDWFDAYFVWQGCPVDRSEAGVEIHRQMQAGFAQRLAAVQEPLPNG